MGLGWGSEAFTVVELLVATAVIAILSSLLLGAVANAKAKARSIICLNHHRQLIQATLLYAGDYNDAFPYNLGSAETRQTVAEGRFLNWVNNVMSWELDEDNTNQVWIQKGGIGPYLSGNVSVFKCPQDFVVSEVQRDAGWEERVRSISMNAMVGNAGAFTSSGVNSNNPAYKQFFKLSQVPAPSRIFVFIEEHPDSIDDGYFLNKAYSGQWHDLPASYHDGGGFLAFADGHVEHHRWNFASTKPPARPDAAHLPFIIPVAEKEDFNWLLEHTSYRAYSKSKPY